MHGKFILSIPMLSATEEKYGTKKKLKFKRIIDSFFYCKMDDQTTKDVLNHLQRIDPHCYPYNVIVGFAELRIDFRDILIYYILNGDGRKIYNKNLKVYRKTANKFYPAFGHVWGASFDTFANNQIRGAMVEALGEIVNDCKTWNLVIDDLYYKKLIQSIDYKRLLQSEL